MWQKVELRTVEEFQHFCLTNAKQRTAAVSSGEIGLSDREQRQYRLGNVIRALTEDKPELAKFEAEVSVEVKRRMGHDSGRGGYAIPHDMLLRAGGRYGARTLSSVTLAGGGQTDTGKHLVPEEHLGDRFVTALRENSVLIGNGVTVIPGLVGDAHIPAELASPAFAWVTEDATPAEGTYTMRNIPLSFKTVAGQVPWTRRLDKQSIPAFEPLLAANMLKGLALALELAIINGSGAAGQPTGIILTAGIGSVVTGVGSPLDYNDGVEFLTDLRATSADPLEAEFLTNSIGMGEILKAKVETGDAVRAGQLIGKDLFFMGRPVRVTNQVPNDDLLFGVWKFIFLGLWGAPEITLDTTTKVATGGKVLRVWQDADVAVAHAGAFTYCNDLTA